MNVELTILMAAIIIGLSALFVTLPQAAERLADQVFAPTHATIGDGHRTDFSAKFIRAWP